MQKIITLIKTYNVARHSSEKALQYILEEVFTNLDVEVQEIAFTNDGYTEITLEGTDEEVAKNFLIDKFGTQKSIVDITVGDIIFGRFVEIDKVNFGLFVDIGARSSTKKIDALYPLFEIRKQLGGNLKVPLTKIRRAYGLIDNLPLYFEVIEKQIIGSKIRVKLTEDSINWLKEFMEEDKESLILTGVTRRMIKQSLIKTNHFEDIEIIERIGLLEYRIVCKSDTRADGLIPEIGHLLGHAKIGAQVPKRLKNLKAKKK